MNNNIFMLIASARSNQFTNVNREGYQKYLENPNRNDLIMRIRSEKNEERQKELERALSGTCDHALNFADGIRHQESAIQSNIYGCDFDFKDNPHLTDPRKYFEEHILPKKDELHLMQCYISTRGKGLQTKCLLPLGSSIAEAQQWQADLVGLKHDVACKNLDRIFIIPHKDDILYMDEEAYFDEKQLPPYTIPTSSLDENNPEDVVKLTNEEFTDSEEVMKHKTFGIDEMELARRVTALVAKHPLPLKEDERNPTLLKAICKYQYVNDDPDKLLKLFTQFGLDKQEVKQIIKNAKGYKKEDQCIDYDVRKIIHDMREEEGLFTTKNLLPCRPIPKKLPIGIQEWVSAAPEGFAPAVIIASLPLLGTLATQISFDYLDGNEHRTSFMSHIEGRFASGKSFIRNMADCFLKHIREQDKTAWEQEKEYINKLNRAKNSNEQPEDPKAVIIEVTHNTSTAKLMHRLERAGGRHLIKVCEEIDVSTKANRAGSWSEHSDIDRLAFDNATYAKDSISMDTYRVLLQFS